MSRKAMKALGIGAVAWAALLATGSYAQTMAQPDPQMAAVLKAQAELGLKPLTALSPEEARKQPTVADGQKELMAKEHKSIDPEPVGSVENAEFPTEDNKTVKVRIYTPVNAGAQPLPVIVYWHGGGWVIGSLDAYDATPRALANGAHAVVVSCDYRLSPENKFPTAHSDALYCYNWATENTKKFNGDPTRIAVAGESAGGKGYCSNK